MGGANRWVPFCKRQILRWPTEKRLHLIENVYNEGMVDIPKGYVTTEAAMEMFSEEEIPTTWCSSQNRPYSLYWRQKFIDRMKELGARQFRMRGVGTRNGRATLWLHSEIKHIGDNVNLWEPIIEEVVQVEGGE